MKKTTPYLHFDGNAEEAMQFYKSVFGGEFIAYHRYGEIPGGEKMSKEEQAKFIHIGLKISQDVSLLATDLLKTMGPLQQGNNFHICLHTDSEQETDRLFDKLAKDGKVEMPLNKTFWGAYFGMVCDKYGVQWMLDYTAS